jgi:hypothetical protein
MSRQRDCCCWSRHCSFATLGAVWSAKALRWRCADQAIYHRLRLLAASLPTPQIGKSHGHSVIRANDVTQVITKRNDNHNGAGDDDRGN